MDKEVKELLEEINQGLPDGYEIGDLNEKDTDLVYCMAYFILSANCDDDREPVTTLEKLVGEIKTEAEDEIKASLVLTLHDMIICTLDSYPPED